MSDAVMQVTDADFGSAVLDHDAPVLVDFWAEWCGPCKRMAPMLDELAAEYGPAVRIAKVDIDANRDTATTYGVMSIPTMKLFRGGEVVYTVVGAKSKATLAAELAPYLPA